ncbi:hypothetical protein SLEP1_g40983 [Rubroshorea leprosula]|uniref:Uncharacterized protein n=1 Tax=Rubroshorea leprosula TaxID=152421 RepID=A0AAV5L547_9ROSI|nr:hypothetical protein SLEP1_g40983 [Rubroshorea leprosula]
MGVDDEADDLMHIFIGHTDLEYRDSFKFHTQLFLLKINIDCVIVLEFEDPHFLSTSEIYAVTCSPTNLTLVTTGGRDDKGFPWRIGKGDWASEL